MELGTWYHAEHDQMILNNCSYIVELRREGIFDDSIISGKQRGTLYDEENDFHKWLIEDIAIL